jgi:endonuclease III related protein
MSASTRSVALSGWRRIPGPPRDPVKARLLRLHATLVHRVGRQGRWPRKNAYEIAVAALLAQNTARTNAARAVAALRARRLLEPHRVLALPEATLAGVIGSGGTSRLKARRLRDFTRWLVMRCDGRFRELRRAPLVPLRAELLAVPGLGPETVDAILLHAANRPVFVADTSTRRVLARHRLLPAESGYEAVRAYLEAHLPSDPALFNELHAALGAVGTAHCGVVPLCAGCPLRGDLRGRPPARA